MIRQRQRAAEPNDPGLSLLEHLEELRWRIVWVAITIFLGMIAGWTVSQPILDHLVVPVGETVFLSPGEAFHTHLRIAFIVGLVLGFPMVLYQIFAFVWPGLYRHERRYVLLFLPLSLALFGAGFAFGYLVMLPMVFTFFLGFESPGIRPAISISSYVSFVTGLVFPAALLFQLPVLVILLSRLGIVTPSFLRRQRKIGILVIFMLAAILTPPDVVSQLILAGPLVGLYELSVILARFGHRARVPAKSSQPE